MVKQAELDRIKQAAFADELEKLAIPVGAIATGLLKHLPKLMMRGAKVLGGKRGAQFLTKSEGVLGSSYRGLRGLAKSKQAFGAKDIYTSGISRMAAKWGTQGGANFAQKGGLATMEQNFAKSNPLANSMPDRWGKKWLGSKMQNPLAVEAKNSMAWANRTSAGQYLKNRPAAFAGQAAQNLNFIRQNGFRNFMKHTVQKSRTFAQKAPNGMTYRYKRSGPGQAAGITMGSPLAWGASDLMTAKDPRTGNKRSMASRVGGAALWTIAPSAATVKMFAGG